MPSFYITSGIEQLETAVALATRLLAEPDYWKKTHDRTKDGSVHGSYHKTAAVAEDRAHGASDADLFVMVLPGGRSSHVELGVALSRRMLFTSNRVVLWVPPGTDGIIFGADSALSAEMLGLGAAGNAFYHYPGVEHFVGTIDDIVPFLKTYNY